MRENGAAEFELEMSLKDIASKIFLYKVRHFILTVSKLHESTESHITNLLYVHMHTNQTNTVNATYLTFTTTYV